MQVKMSKSATSPITDDTLSLVEARINSGGDGPGFFSVSCVSRTILRTVGDTIAKTTTTATRDNRVPMERKSPKFVFGENMLMVPSPIWKARAIPKTGVKTAKISAYRENLGRSLTTSSLLDAGESVGRTGPINIANIM